MTKKMMLLALSVVSASLFALPAVTSATPAHISATENFAITGANTVELETDTGEKWACHNGVTGSGAFENTTTGSLTLTFHNCTVGIFGSCGTIVTTSLPFHLIRIATHSPGILITPNSATGAFAHFACFGATTWTGNGIIATITSPTCGTASTTANLSFQQGAGTGLPQHTTYTGVNYHLETGGGRKLALSFAGAIHFAAPKVFVCT